MIERYTRRVMADHWSDLNKKALWHRVELAILHARIELESLPAEIWRDANNVLIGPAILQRADELEVLGDHDLIAFVLAVSERLKESTRVYYHTGVTSFDIEDTALALLLVKAMDILIADVECLRSVIYARAIEHKKTVMIGRTHFIHAEPITFGLELLNYVDVLDRHLERMKVSREEARVGKISGAVGKYSLDPIIEALACAFLGLKPAKISTQILSRDILTRFISTLVGVSNSLEKLAIDLRLLSGTDLSEVAEYKSGTAKGSSAMPGKSFLRNPIKFENFCALVKVMRGYLVMAYENEAVWLQRTLENSGLERILVPDASTLLDFILARLTAVMERLEVFPEQMMSNLQKTGGIVFAQRIMIALTQKGMPRDKAYDLLESLAKSVKRGAFTNAAGQNFMDLVKADTEIANLLSGSELQDCFNPELSLKHIDEIFARFE